MIKLGEWQELTILKIEKQGAYLIEEGNEAERVLLPQKQIPDGASRGSRLNVFIYLDSMDRIIATVNKPLITLGKVAMLKVKNTSNIGAFVDWGLEKDLLLPFKEQTKHVSPDEEVLCALYIDKSNRLCLTMNVYEYLLSDSPYNVDDEVEGYVYEMSGNFGAFVAVDNIYSALIPKKELYGGISVGYHGKFRVTSKTEDNRLNLAVRKKAYLQMDDDAEKILSVIQQYGGVLPFNDKASPETIKTEFDMSKNEFKRAVGRLYKERKIEITDKSIKLVKPSGKKRSHR